MQSTLLAWVAFAIVIIVIVTTFQYRQQWWSFIDLFFAFMMVFCQLVALYIKRFNPYAGKKLQSIAAICMFLTILAFIGEYVVYQIT